MNCVKKAIERLLGRELPEPKIDVDRKGYIAEEFFHHFIEDGKIPLVFSPVVSTSDYPNHHVVNDVFLELLKTRNACLGVVTPRGNYHYVVWEYETKKLWCPDRGVLDNFDDYSIIEVLTTIKYQVESSVINTIQQDPIKESIWDKIKK